MNDVNSPHSVRSRTEDSPRFQLLATVNTVNLRKSPRLAPVGPLVALLVACACSASPQSEPAKSAPPASPKDDAAASSPSVHGGEAPSEADEAPPAAEAPYEEAPGKSSLKEEEKKKGSEDLPLLDQLRAEEADFDEALDPEALSCAGALPLRDAICALAGRICGDGDPNPFSNPSDCKKAKTACENAKAQYQKKCG